MCGRLIDGPMCQSLGLRPVSGVRGNCFSRSGGKQMGSASNRARTSSSACGLVVESGRVLLSVGGPLHFVFSRATLHRN